MPSNYTPNYQLSQWEADDRVLRADFNADNAKIDAALSLLSSGKGNCRIETGSYEGDGSGPRTFTFAKKPLLLIVDSPSDTTVAVQGAPRSHVITLSAYNEANLTWSGNSVTFQADRASLQLNQAGTTYHYIVLAAE